MVSLSNHEDFGFVLTLVATLSPRPSKGEAA
jgi:hypothetical protein